MSFKGMLIKAGINPRSNGQLEFRKPALFTQGFIEPVGRGKVWYVDSVNGSSTNNGKTPYTALSTIDAAVGKCTASQGDIIKVLPGHEETVTTDGGLALDVAGITIIGYGRYNERPKIILDSSAAAAVTVSAANIGMQNFVFEASYADITNAIDVTAKGFHLDSCHFQEEGANLNFIDYIVCSGAANTADGLTITNCSGYGVDAAINSPLRIVNDLKDLVFCNNMFNTDNANALAMIQCATGKDLNNCYVVGNVYASLKASGDILIDNDTTANDGWVAYNFALHQDTDAEVLVDCDGVGLFENYGTAVVTASGYLLPAADS